MISTEMDRAARRYLRRLKTCLAGVPEEARDSILQDVRAHIEEATASGRSCTQVLAGLGDPRQLADSSRAELGGGAAPVPGRLDAGTLLGGITVALAVMAAVIVSFFLRNPEGQHPDSATEPEGSVATLLELYGPGVALLTLIPAAVILLALLLPRSVRRWALLAVAFALTVLVFLDFFATGLFAVPMALTAWMSATIPFARGRGAGRAEGLAVRTLGTALLLAPVLLVTGGLMVGNLDTRYLPMLIWVLFSVVLAIGFALNRRAAHWAVLGYGVLLLGVAVFDAGILLAAFWLGGGVMLCLGLYGLLRLNPAVSPSVKVGSAS